MSRQINTPTILWQMGSTVEVTDRDGNEFTFTDWCCPFCNRYMTEYNPYYQHQPVANFCPHCGRLINTGLERID